MAQTFVSHTFFQGHARSVYGFLENHWNFNEWKVVVLDFYTFCGRGKTQLKLGVAEKKTQVPCLICS